jgi:hypothetical protein
MIIKKIIISYKILNMYFNNVCVKDSKKNNREYIITF